MTEVIKILKTFIENQNLSERKLVAKIRTKESLNWIMSKLNNKTFFDFLALGEMNPELKFLISSKREDKEKGIGEGFAKDMYYYLFLPNSKECQKAKKNIIAFIKTETKESPSPELILMYFNSWRFEVEIKEELIKKASKILKIKTMKFLQVLVLLFMPEIQKGKIEETEELILMINRGFCSLNKGKLKVEKNGKDFRAKLKEKFFKDLSITEVGILIKTYAEHAGFESDMPQKVNRLINDGKLITISRIHGVFKLSEKATNDCKELIELAKSIIN